MGKYTAEQACEARAQASTVTDHLCAAYWHDADDTRDFLVGIAINAMTKALAVLGKRVIDCEPIPAADDDEPYYPPTDPGRERFGSDY